MSAQGSFARIAREGGRAALVTVVEGPAAGRRVLIDPDGVVEGSLGDPELDARALEIAGELIWKERTERREELFFDVVAPTPRLLIFGAVEYANHLSRLARDARWRAFVIDPRPRFATAARFPAAAGVVVGWPEKALAELGGIDPATYIAVLTHDPKIDDEVLLAALAAEPAYIGAMGARRTQARRNERLREKGVADADLERISQPIGLDLGAFDAEEVAISIMGEMVAVRHGRDGGRLSQRGPNAAAIH